MDKVSTSSDTASQVVHGAPKPCTTRLLYPLPLLARGGAAEASGQGRPLATKGAAVSCQGLCQGLCQGSSRAAPSFWKPPRSPQGKGFLTVLPQRLAWASLIASPCVSMFMFLQFVGNEVILGLLPYYPPKLRDRDCGTHRPWHLVEALQRVVGDQ